MKNISLISENILLSNPKSLNKNSIIDKEILESVCDRIYSLQHDCTPNWGIKGTKESKGVKKLNWYLKDMRAKCVAQERFDNIDSSKLITIVNEIVKDTTGNGVQVSGIGLYGSYFYRRNSLQPDDLDMLIIVKSEEKIALDALRYPCSEIKNIYRNKSRIIPSSCDVGFGIVSENNFKEEEKSFIVTDAALLDISTTFSIGVTVDAKPLPPYVIIQNAQKIINWGVSSLLSKPFSLYGRIDEAIRMRNLAISQFPTIKFDKKAIENALPSKEDILLGVNDIQLLDISRSIINVLKDDEKTIKDYYVARISK